MKKFSRIKSLVVLILLFLASVPLHALDTSETRTINVPTAGSLSTVLPQGERLYVVNLTITGKLNGSDFNILRSMATDQKLQTLDLQGADIVSGGDSYYSNYGTNYYTKNNEFGYSLFNGCKNIQKIVLPNSLVTIGQCAFWYCTNLETLVIGSKVTTIQPGLWGGCSKLTDVQLKNNTNFHFVNGVLYNSSYTVIIAAIQAQNYGNLTIRTGVKEIQYNAFAFCSKMTSVTFPTSVTTIGETAFEHTGITSVTFTNAITSIGSFAFSGCKSLKELDLTPLKLTTLDYGLFMTSNVEVVYMPKTLKELKQSVFSGTQLKHIFVYTATPATMYDLATSSPTFKNVDVENCTVHVPQGKVNTYKTAAGWKDFYYITDSQEIEASTDEAYAVYTDDGTLTFYYDKQKSSRSGTKYSLNTGKNDPEWYTEHRKDIKRAVFSSSFAEARPTSTYKWFAYQSNLAEVVGTKYLNTSNVTSMGLMFLGCSGLTSLDVRNFKTDNVTEMTSMFYGCSGLTSLNVTDFRTDNVTNMGNMFRDCSSLTSLNVTGFRTDNVTSMSSMFYGCSSLTSLDVNSFKTDNVKSMGWMFLGCSGLTSLDVRNFKTGNVTEMTSMFYGCFGLTSLDLSNFNTANVTYMNGMFYGCSSLTSLDLSSFNTANATQMNGMFEGCSSLTSLDLSSFNTANVEGIHSMFMNCSSLTTIFANESNWSTSKVKYGEDMFANCTNIEGGNGTVYDANHTDYEYARIDKDGQRGYLTDKLLCLQTLTIK